MIARKMAHIEHVNDPPSKHLIIYVYSLRRNLIYNIINVLKKYYILKVSTYDKGGNLVGNKKSSS